MTRTSHDIVPPMDIFNRILFTYRRRGAIGFLRLLLKNTVQHPRKLLTSRYFRQSSQDTSEFDAIHGTDTEQVREIYDMDIPTDRWRDANRYQPSPHNLAKKLIHGLNIDCSKYTFLDYGAGKGRVLLIAAELPFHAVIGIELSAELCATATANIDMAGPATLKAREIRCAHADATSFTLPDNSLVCYFYNPFGESVLQAVADSLAASLDASPRAAYVIYVQPEHRNVFEATGLWDRVENDQFYAVYRFLDGTRPKTAS